jgi:hypothetical protein
MEQISKLLELCKAARCHPTTAEMYDQNLYQDFYSRLKTKVATMNQESIPEHRFKRQKPR